MIHVLIHGLHYEMDVFESVRAYDIDRDPAIFHWEEHLERLYQSAKPYDMEIPYTHEELTETALEVIRRNDLDGGYIRPVVFYDHDSLGVSPEDNPTEVAIVVWPWRTYLGEDAPENSIDVMVSSWRKHASSQVPTNAKTIGPYVNSMLTGEEAHRNGYVEAIVLNKEGNAAEGPDENIFMVRDEKIYTPGLSQSILDGIAHDIVVTPARERSYKADNNTAISRGELNTADELFSVGSAIEVTPIRKVDNVVIGEGTRGSVTEELQSVFFDPMEYRTSDHEEWFTYVDEQ